jgi:hypothetical protein
MKNQFFEYASKRHYLYLAQNGAVEFPEDSDYILNNWYFTNVYRELDKTTEWFRENVRRDLQLQPEVIPATMLFRWFNRMNIGETVFCQNHLIDNNTAFNDYIATRDLEELKARILNAHPKGPYVNGAYIIKAYNGMDKLSGVLRAFDEAMKQIDSDHGSYQKLAEWMILNPSMEDATRYFATLGYLGKFMAYEIVCDLRYTVYLAEATDIKTWANPGPGARRGLARIMGQPPSYHISTKDCVAQMRELLGESVTRGWTDWEMREVEHTLCEFDKYRRIAEGGRGKRRYLR